MLMTSFLSRFVSILLSASVSVAPTFFIASAQADTIEPPPESGAPSGTVGGASRPIKPTCIPSTIAAQKSLIAVTPKQKIGQTTSAHPQLTVLLPATTAQAVEISLFDAQMRGIYQTTVAIPEQTGLVSFHLPKDAPALEVGKTYRWTIALICNRADRTEDWVVGGWIQRSQLTPALSAQLVGKSALEQVTLYAQAGFWYDALGTLTQTQSVDTSALAIARTWNQLLRTAELETIVTINTL